MKKMKWQDRPNVRNCEDREYCDCYYCKVGVHCNHAGCEGDCTEKDCPRFNGKRWIK